MTVKCVECGSHVPAYLNYLCEDCWKEMLHQSVVNEDVDSDMDS